MDASVVDRGTGGAGSSSASFFDTGGAPPAPPFDGSACAAMTAAPETVAREMYVVVDESASMGAFVPGSTSLTLAQAVEQGISQFVGAGRGAVALGFFNEPEGQTFCDPSSFTTPKAEIAGGDTSGITGAYAAYRPSGTRPLGTAIRGALEYADAELDGGNTSPSLIVVITSGPPTGCDSSTVTQMASVVRAEFENAHHITTVILELPGATDGGLDTVAEAGGSGKAIAIDASDVAGNVAKALANIQIASPCVFAVPNNPRPFDLNLVNVVSTDSPIRVYYRVNDGTQCANDGDGWYYDDPSAPTTIFVCGAACAGLYENGGGVQVTFACGGPLLPPI
jgi:hypothetical protein